MTAVATVVLALIARKGFKQGNETAEQAVRLERAKWAAQLSLQFFSEQFRSVREALDEPAAAAALSQMVKAEDERLTEFLNFFELVAYLLKSGQILRDDLRAVFGYYLPRFSVHAELRDYIRKPQNSYEQLNALLDSL